MASLRGKDLDEIYKLAWKKGLKKTYYLRAQSATHVEKSTIKNIDGKLNAVSIVSDKIKACTLDDTDCEACQ